MNVGACLLIRVFICNYFKDGKIESLTRAMPQTSLPFRFICQDELLQLDVQWIPEEDPIAFSGKSTNGESCFDLPSSKLR